MQWSNWLQSVKRILKIVLKLEGMLNMQSQKENTLKTKAPLPGEFFDNIVRYLPDRVCI